VTCSKQGICKPIILGDPKESFLSYKKEEATIDYFLNNPRRLGRKGRGDGRRKKVSHGLNVHKGLAVQFL
jgi:hypothetical protein